MSDQKASNVFKLVDVRLAFPALFVPRAASADKPNDLSFSCSFLMAPDHPARKQLSDVIRKVAADKWGVKAEENVKLMAMTDKLCIHNGDTKPNLEGYPGNYFVNARNKTRPGVFDLTRAGPDGKALALGQSDGKPYAGCYVNASVEIWAQDNKFGKRVNASLRGVWFLRDGDAFAGGGVADADEFEPMTSGADSDSLV